MSSVTPKSLRENIAHNDNRIHELNHILSTLMHERAVMSNALDFYEFKDDEENVEALSLYRAGWRAIYETDVAKGGDWDDWSGTYKLTTPTGDVWTYFIEPSHNGPETEFSRPASAMRCNPHTCYPLSTLNPEVIELLENMEGQ